MSQYYGEAPTFMDVCAPLTVLRHAVVTATMSLDTMRVLL